MNFCGDKHLASDHVLKVWPEWQSWTKILIEHPVINLSLRVKPQLASGLIILNIYIFCAVILYTLVYFQLLHTLSFLGPTCFSSGFESSSGSHNII
jgi:hypothetical protein